MDKQIFEALISRYRPFMLALARGKLGNDASAEDAVQIACLRVWQAAPNLHFRSETQAKRYLAIAVSSAAVDILRQRPELSSVSYSDLLAEPETYDLTVLSPGAELAARETAGRVLDLLAGLGPKTYRVLSLRAEGFGNKEIAAMLELSVYDVGMTVYRGRKRLRELLKQEGIAL